MKTDRFTVMETDRFSAELGSSGWRQTAMAGRASTLRRIAPARVFDKQIRKLNQLAG
ncbi:hypothetical protein [Nonomuraea sp. NPDC049158]|uniref:hypothetical protein n=1 Tax=Nonomuraea sp. NPDC049158 TaxID=3155649 RepID=UPI0033E66FED